MKASKGEAMLGNVEHQPREWKGGRGVLRIGSMSMLTVRESAAEPLVLGMVAFEESCSGSEG